MRYLDPSERIVSPQSYAYYWQGVVATIKFDGGTKGGPGTNSFRVKVKRFANDDVKWIWLITNKEYCTAEEAIKDLDLMIEERIGVLDS